MTDLLLSPWLYVFGFGVIILAHSLLVSAAHNTHVRWHKQLEDHEAEKHGKHLAQRRLKAREKRENAAHGHGDDQQTAVGSGDETLAVVLEKALREEREGE